MCFKSNADVQVYEELKNLNDYLHYCIKQKEYEAKVAVAKVSFKDFHRNHVEVELHRQSELADMWLNGDIIKQRHERCEEVCFNPYAISLDTPACIGFVLHLYVMCFARVLLITTCPLAIICMFFTCTSSVRHVIFTCCSHNNMSINFYLCVLVFQLIFLLCSSCRPTLM